MQATTDHPGVFRGRKGYIQNPSTKAERDKYNADRYDEYEFIVSYEKDTDPDTNENHYFNFYMVPMRFTIQTYADMSKWEKKADEAQEFLIDIRIGSSWMRGCIGAPTSRR